MPARDRPRQASGGQQRTPPVFIDFAEDAEEDADGEEEEVDEDDDLIVDDADSTSPADPVDLPRLGALSLEMGVRPEAIVRLPEEGFTVSAQLSTATAMDPQRRIIYTALRSRRPAGNRAALELQTPAVAWRHWPPGTPAVDLLRDMQEATVVLFAVRADTRFKIICIAAADAIESRLSGATRGRERRLGEFRAWASLPATSTLSKVITRYTAQFHACRWTDVDPKDLPLPKRKAATQAPHRSPAEASPKPAPKAGTARVPCPRRAHNVDTDQPTQVPPCPALPGYGPGL